MELTSVPLRACRAWVRKLRTETPGISWGYWKARNRPALPRTSGGQEVMSSPLKRIEPRVTWYSGLPSRAAARVDFPDPLGPMRACSSPAPTTRSTPRSISAPPSVVATCRPSISKSGAAGTPRSYGPTTSGTTADDP